MYAARLRKLVKRLSPSSKEEVGAFLLQDLFHNRPYLPYTNSSIALHSLACMVNDLLLNNRKSILEFGCGISTIIMARAINRNNIQAKITSVEESADWIQVIKTFLQKEDMQGYVNFIHAPLKKSNEIPAAKTYDIAIVNEELKDKRFDMVFIDGPSANNKSNENSRISTLSLFKEKLNESYVIFIDNVDRKGEKILVKNIQDQLNAKHIKIGDTFQACCKGNHFNFVV